MYIFVSYVSENIANYDQSCLLKIEEEDSEPEAVYPPLMDVKSRLRERAVKPGEWNYMCMHAFLWYLYSCASYI